MKGYKIFNPNWMCKGHQYAVGKVYEYSGKIELCKSGFHFYTNPVDLFNYYAFDPENKVAEVEALGAVIVGNDDSKCVTDKIKIIRAIPWEEVLRLVNKGDGNTGDRNTGSYNTGDRNTGNYNTGHWNTGHWNTGSYNTGYRNTGHCNTGNSNEGDWNTGDGNIGDWNTGSYNTGDWNTGSYNTGYWNTGSCNTGYCNTGDCNEGDRNTGNYNTGRWNTGHWNEGDWNTGNYNTGDGNTGDFNLSNYNAGCFNTNHHKLKFFDKEADITMDEWRESEAYKILSRVRYQEWIKEEDMKEEEKLTHPVYKTTGGYLKEYTREEAFNIWWNSLSKKEKQIIKEIPNFDAEKFELITGIKV